jgi:protein transport protein SEC31
LNGKGNSQLKLSGNGNECKPLVDGSVNLYNPAKIIGSPAAAEPPADGGASSALITKMQKHTGPVRGRVCHGHLTPL